MIGEDDAVTSDEVDGRILRTKFTQDGQRPTVSGEKTLLGLFDEKAVLVGRGSGQETGIMDYDGGPRHPV